MIWDSFFPFFTILIFCRFHIFLFHIQLNCFINSKYDNHRKIFKNSISVIIIVKPSCPSSLIFYHPACKMCQKKYSKNFKKTDPTRLSLNHPFLHLVSLFILITKHRGIIKAHTNVRDTSKFLYWVPVYFY